MLKALVLKTELADLLSKVENMQLATKGAMFAELQAKADLYLSEVDTLDILVSHTQK